MVVPVPSLEKGDGDDNLLCYVSLVKQLQTNYYFGAYLPLVNVELPLCQSVCDYLILRYPLRLTLNHVIHGVMVTGTTMSAAEVEGAGNGVNMSERKKTKCMAEEEPNQNDPNYDSGSKQPRWGPQHAGAKVLASQYTFG